MMSQDAVSCKGTILGKFTVEGSLTAQNLANSVQVLYNNWTKNETTDHRCVVHCGEFGLRLESCRKDEGFESDTDSSEQNSIPKANLGAYHNDSFGECSSSANSSGSDSECDSFNRSSSAESPRQLSTERETYDFHDVVFCHSEASLPKLIVWVVRIADHLQAIVFLSHSEDNFKQLLNKYQDLNKQKKFNKRYRGSRSSKSSNNENLDATTKTVTSELCIPPPAEFADPDNLSPLITIVNNNNTPDNNSKSLITRSLSLVNSPVISVEPWNARHSASTRKLSLNHVKTTPSWNLIQKVDINGITHLNVDRNEAKSLPPASTNSPNEEEDTFIVPQLKSRPETKLAIAPQLNLSQILSLSTPEENETPVLETCEVFNMKPLEFFRMKELENQASKSAESQPKPKPQPKVGKIQSTVVKDLEAVLEAQLKRRQLPSKPIIMQTDRKTDKSSVPTEKPISKSVLKRAESPDGGERETQRRGRSQTRFPHFKLLSQTKSAPNSDNNNTETLTSNHTAPSVTQLLPKPSFFRRERGRSLQRKTTVVIPPPPPWPGTSATPPAESSYHQQKAYLVPTKTGQEPPSKHAFVKEGRRLLPHPAAAAALYHPRYVTGLHPQPHFLPGHPVLNPWFVNVNDSNDVNNNRRGPHSLILIRPWWEEPSLMRASHPACHISDEETFEEKRRRSRSKSPARRSNRWMDLPFSLTTAMPEHLSQHHEAAGILHSPSSSKFLRIKEWSDSVMSRWNNSSKLGTKAPKTGEMEPELEVKDIHKSKDHNIRDKETELDRKVTFNDFATVQVLKSVN